MANKKLTIKHFADLKMHGVPIAEHKTPFQHKAAKHLKGSQLMHPTDMASGNTGGEIPFDHTNIQD